MSGIGPGNTRQNAARRPIVTCLERSLRVPRRSGRVDPAGAGDAYDHRVAGARRGRPGVEPVDEFFKRGWLAASFLSVGFVVLFFPHWLLGHSVTLNSLLLVVLVALLACYLGYSFLQISLQAWGARLGGDTDVRSRIVGWREGLALAGVILASVVPGWLGMEALVSGFVMLPFGVKTADEAGVAKVPGQADSAPVNFQPGKVAARASVVAAVATALFVANYHYGWITAADLDVLPKPPAAGR